MSETTITEIRATSEEIIQIVDELEPIVLAYPPAHSIMAMLSITLMMQKPDITPKEISDGVRAVSEAVCTFLASTTEEHKKNRALMN